MKKLILLITTLLVSLTSYSQVKFTGIAYTIGISNGKDYKWKDIEDCKVPVYINFEKGEVVIYSSEIQEYYLIKSSCTQKVNSKRDNDISYTFYAVDSEFSKCKIEFRFWNSTGGQERAVYIYYNDIAWSYYLE